MAALSNNFILVRPKLTRVALYPTPIILGSSIPKRIVGSPSGMVGMIWLEDEKIRFLLQVTFRVGVFNEIILKTGREVRSPKRSGE